MVDVTVMRMYMIYVHIQSDIHIVILNIIHLSIILIIHRSYNVHLDLFKQTRRPRGALPDDAAQILSGVGLLR